MKEIDVEPGYEVLHNVLIDALEQAQHGKGKERHQQREGDLFIEQPIMLIQEMVGEGYALGQAIKKLQESTRLDDEAAIKERLGAIVYIAGSIIHRRCRS